jgi:hypothetical protein
VRLYLRSSERRPDPPPLRTDDRRTVTVGIAVWAVLGVAAVIFHDRLAGAGYGWAVWTPPAGIVLGLLGLLYIRDRPGPGDPPRAG